MTLQEVTRLLDYNYWARDRLLTAVELLSAEQYTRDMSSSFPSIRDTLVHIYGAEWIWCERWKGTSPAHAVDATAFPDVPHLRAAWAGVEADVRRVVAKYGASGLDELVDFRTLRGDPYRQVFWQMVQHVVNHGSYHRGQITTMLRQLKAQPPAPLDLIAFYREPQA